MPINPNPMTIDRNLLRNFRKYSNRQRRNGRFYKEETPVEQSYLQDDQLRKNLSSGDIADLVKSGVLLLTPSAATIWAAFYSEKALLAQFGSLDSLKYIIPVGLIVVTLYTIVFVPMLIIRAARRKRMFCSRCGHVLRLTSGVDATWYVCDSCERWTGVVNLDLDGPQ